MLCGNRLLTVCTPVLRSDLTAGLTRFRAVASFHHFSVSQSHTDKALSPVGHFIDNRVRESRLPQSGSNQVRSYTTSKVPNGSDIAKDVEQNLKKMREGKFDEKVAHPEELQHFKVSQHLAWEAREEEKEPPIGHHALPHPIWTEKDLHSVRVTHMQPKGIIDKLAFSAVKMARFGFDFLSGYNRKPRTEDVWLKRVIFLETVAGVPGMVAAMVRHLHSLRRMRRDHGWIHTLLEEAENERMHLMTAMQLKKPSFLFRWSVVGAQGVFVAGFSVAYLLSPRFCHRFVGYLEEEAVVTYSKLLKILCNMALTTFRHLGVPYPRPATDIDTGLMQHWATQPAPPVAIRYWQLKPEAVMTDVVLAIRADEAHHRVVNHTLGSMRPDDYNPYKPGQ